MAETKTVNLNIETNLGSLRSQLKAAQKEVEVLSEKFGATSEAATEAAIKAAQLKDAIGDAKDLTDAFNPDAKFNALGGALQGVAGGFSAVQGALGFVGVESKNIEAALLKVQSAMAFSEGINSIMAAKDSFTNLSAVIGKTAIGQKALNVVQIVGATVMKALNLVMKANPIFLIISGILAAIAAFKYFSSSTETATANNEKLNASLERQEKAMDRNAATIKRNGENRLKILVAQGASEQTIHNQTLKNLKNEEAARAKNVEFLKQKLDQKRAILKQAYYEENDELIKSTKKEINESRGKYSELVNQKKTNITNIRVEEITYNNKVKKDEEEKTAKQKEENNKRAEKQREHNTKVREDKKKADEDLKAQILKAQKELDDEINRIAEEQLDKQKKAQEDRKEKAKKDEEDIYNNAKGFLEASIIEDENNLQAKKDLLEVEKEILLQNTELTQGEIAAIEAKYRADREQLDKEEIAKKKVLEGQKLQAVQDTFSTIGNLAELFAGKSRKQQETAFKIQKAANIANATIDTYKAAQGAYASLSSIPVVGVGLGIAAAGAALTAGLLNVKKIASTKFDGGGATGGGGGSTPSGGGGGATSGSVITPNFNIVGNNGTNQLKQLQQAPVQAYVVSGEMSTQQSLDRNRLRNATL
jgi:type II secretory pathway pseudopilin PulG